MRRTDFLRKSPPRAPNGENARFVIIAFIATVTVALAILIVTLPRQVVLPTFSICALAAAACVALVASFRTGVRRLSAWNLAGAFTLVGCAAAILGEIEAIVEYTRMTAPRSRADD
jgi:choline-glycine betaine transporter